MLRKLLFTNAIKNASANILQFKLSENNAKNRIFTIPNYTKNTLDIAKKQYPTSNFYAMHYFASDANHTSYLKKFKQLIDIKYGNETKILQNNPGSTITLVPTMHPVINPNVNNTYISKKTGLITSKSLWYETKDYFDNLPKLIENIKNKNVILRNWVGTDCDRHPDHRPGMISYIAILEKMKILEALKIDVQKKQELDQCINELNSHFAQEKSKNLITNQYQNILLNNKNEIKQLNQAWKANLEQVRKIYQGSDYRVSGDDLKDIKHKNYETIAQTLKEIEKSEIDIQRFIVADCDSKQQILEAKKLISALNLKNLEIIPLFEDRISTNDIKEILESNDNIKTIQIAGSDSKRRVGQIGVFALLSNVIEATQSVNKDRKFKIFIGSGNTHWRTEDLSAFVPQEYEIERTIQGQLVPSLSKDQQLCNNFINDQAEKLNKRPSLEDLTKIKDLLQKLDKKQKEYQDNNQNKPIFKKEPIELLLNSTKFFGSRFKPNIFSNENGISQQDLLDKSRAIEHAWVHQMTGCPASEIADLSNIISDGGLKDNLIKNKENPYIKSIIENALKSIWYSDQDLAKKYCVNQEIVDEKFEQLENVNSFIEKNFKDIYNNQEALIINDLKLNKDFDFSQGKEGFKEFRNEIATNIQNKIKNFDLEVDPAKKINRDIDLYYKNSNGLHNITGRNFSSIPGRVITNANNYNKTAKGYNIC